MLATLITAKPEEEVEYPPGHPVWWTVSYDGRSVDVLVQSWFAARDIGAAQLGVDHALVRVKRKDEHESDAARVDATLGARA